MAESEYMRKRREILLGIREPDPKKEPKPIAKESAKTKAKKAAEKKERGGDDTVKEKWFRARRKEMTGTCQCGCAEPSHKNSDVHFRGSAAHIFPKADFESIALHPLNWVERRMFGGCHDKMEPGHLDQWPNMADWPDIREKFFVLAPLLTDEERGRKFYKELEWLVYNNP